MNIEQVLGHHLLDHSFFTLFTLPGGVAMNLTKHLVMIWLVSAFSVLSLGYAARGTGPAARILRGGVETLALYIRDNIVDPLLGHDGHKYLHYFLTLFFFIFFCNLAGMLPLDAIPGNPGISGTATGNVGVTAGLALCTLGLIVLGGVRAQGLIGFLKHFAPVPAGLPMSVIATPVLGAVLFVIEIVGLAVKIFALTIRLFANMIAGHIVIIGFFSLIFIIGRSGVFVAGPFALFMVTFVNCLELLVAFLQAFIFTLLTAVFVGGVMQHH
ncbi:MAG: F0F1 ATP synthase subunit A [Elusimicrobia bacterium]|nr:F0F1 ATP synthase subunit A [Elusimicrobiota bacterium]